MEFPKNKTHIDDWVSGYREDKSERYAAWWFVLFRFPAIMKANFTEFTKDLKLFCDYDSKRYRVVGASRMGDVWLTDDFSRENGYDLRVYVDDCSKWSDKP